MNLKTKHLMQINEQTTVLSFTNISCKKKKNENFHLQSIQHEYQHATASKNHAKYLKNLQFQVPIFKN